MVSVYRKVAEGVANLGKNIDFLGGRVPVGFDGAILEHLLQYFYERDSKIHGDYLGYAVQISSRTGEIDSEKFSDILSDFAGRHKPLYAIDFRTVTGSLGRKIKEEVHNWETKKDMSVEFYYAVVFDPNGKADIRGSDEELSDKEREEVRWVDGEEKIRELIYKENGKWKYNFTHEAISNFKPVPLIKREIDSLTDYIFD